MGTLIRKHVNSIITELLIKQELNCQGHLDIENAHDQDVHDGSVMERDGVGCSGEVLDIQLLYHLGG